MKNECSVKEEEEKDDELEQLSHRLLTSGSYVLMDEMSPRSQDEAEKAPALDSQQSKPPGT